MTDDDSPAPRRRFVDLTPLRASRPFARLWIGANVSNIGAWVTQVAVGLQIYDLTRSTFAVSLVGGISLLPLIVAGLWGGMLADAFDRRTVLVWSSLVGWLSTIGLITLTLADATLAGHVPVWPFYLLTTLTAVASTVSATTRSAAYPRLLPHDLLPAANALNGVGFGLTLAIGPAVAGILVAAIGYAGTYLVDVVLFAVALWSIGTMPKMPPEHDATRPGLRSLADGLVFLRRAPNIRAGFVIDLVAMTLGRPIVLLPAAGAMAIGGGSITVGILTASIAIGTFLTGLFSGPVGHVRRQGLAIGGAVMVFGAFTALFGGVLALAITGVFGPVGESFDAVSIPALVLAGLALMGTGAADEVSAIFRSTMLATAVPDAMRGRMQGIFIVVVTGGPRLGDLYGGILATAVALWFPPALGGLLIVAIAAILVRAVATFRSYDAQHPTP